MLLHQPIDLFCGYFLIPLNFDMPYLEKRREENPIHDSAQKQKTCKAKPKKSILQNLFEARTFGAKPPLWFVSFWSHNPRRFARIVSKIAVGQYFHDNG